MNDNPTLLSEIGDTREKSPCDGCGICCLNLSLPPFDANEELHGASDELLEEIEAYAKSPRYHESSPCLWLDLGTGKCKHHRIRPTLCRWFEPGCAACNELREGSGLPRLLSAPAEGP